MTTTPPAVADHSSNGTTPRSDTVAAASVTSREEESQAPGTRDGRWAVLFTTLVCAVAAGAGHLVLLTGWMARSPGADSNVLPWQPVIGASLAVTAIVSFGGFYLATLRARIAIMSSFLLTFLLLLTFVLTVRELQPDASQSLMETMTGDFRVIVQTIVGFYFGTETILSITKIIRSPATDAAAIRRADRDLPAGTDRPTR